MFQLCFAISYRRENQRQYELKAATESDCKTWIDAIREARLVFNKIKLWLLWRGNIENNKIIYDEEINLMDLEYNFKYKS